MGPPPPPGGLGEGWQNLEIQMQSWAGGNGKGSLLEEGARRWAAFCNPLKGVGERRRPCWSQRMGQPLRRLFLRTWRPARVAISNTSLTPSLVLAEHSRYPKALMRFAMSRPSSDRTGSWEDRRQEVKGSWWHSVPLPTSAISVGSRTNRSSSPGPPGQFLGQDPRLLVFTSNVSIDPVFHGTPFSCLNI